MSDEQPIAEVIEQAEKESARSGNRISRVIDKRKFLTEFPHAAGDPRMSLTPNLFELNFTPLEGMSVGQLRTLCLRKKGHPLAIQKALQVEGFPDSQTVFILKQEARILAGD
jgi:hypothetical protein